MAEDNSHWLELAEAMCDAEVNFIKDGHSVNSNKSLPRGIGGRYDIIVRLETSRKGIQENPP